MAINFEEIRDLAKQRIEEEKSLNVEKELTQQDKEDIKFLVSEMEKYIKQYADQGKQTFSYDCSRLERHVFFALATAFVEENPNFFVTTLDGAQEMTVDWSGKHEV